MNQYYILIGIIYMIPFLIMIGISISRKRLETDRNFYGNEIQTENIELTNVKYNSFEVQRDEIKKITEMGKIKYVYDGYYEDETKEENLCCRQVKRGEVYFADYYYDNGILADKRRPAVIVSNHGINEKAQFVKVVYLTTAPKSNHPAHVKVQCGKPGTALCEKSQTISKSFLENYIGTLTEEEMFQIDRGIQIGYGIKNNVYDYDNEEDSFVKDIANYIQEMDHLLSKLCDLKELDQKARHIDIEQLLGKDVIALGRILPDSGLEAVRAAMVSQADKEQKKIREKLELMIGKR